MAGARRTHVDEGRPQLDTPRVVRERMVGAARDLRRGATSSEAILWAALRGRRLDGWKFRRQQPFGPFVGDFFCAELRLVVEVDGAVHQQRTRREADESRQQVLESLDLRVLRIPAADVERDVELAIAAIRHWIATEHKTSPLPPWERGRG